MQAEEGSDSRCRRGRQLNLNEVLGVEVETTLGDIREEMARAEQKGTVPANMTKGGLRGDEVQFRAGRGRRLRHARHGKNAGQGLLLLCQRRSQNPDRQIRRKLQIHGDRQRSGAGAYLPRHASPT